MKHLRIIDKETKIWLRDDYVFDEETEMGIDLEIQQPPIKAESYICPMWDGEKWVQNVEPPEPEIEPQEPTETERIEALEQALLEIVLGGVFNG